MKHESKNKHIYSHFHTQTKRHTHTHVPNAGIVVSLVFHDAAPLHNIVIGPKCTIVINFSHLSVCCFLVPHVSMFCSCCPKDRVKKTAHSILCQSNEYTKISRPYGYERVAMQYTKKKRICENWHHESRDGDEKNRNLFFTQFDLNH